jgi:hypothetical protein
LNETLLEAQLGVAACPDCGASWAGGRACRAIFDEFLVLELTEAGYGEVHLLTVACYMIQHGQYSEAGLHWIESRLRDHLEEGVPARQIRQGAKKEMEQSRRDWKVTRRPGDPPQAKIPWSMTIVDVAEIYQDAGSYRELVKDWARTTVREMKPLLTRPGSGAP